MSAVINRTMNRASAGLVGVATTGFITYKLVQRPHRLDDGTTRRNALSFPYNMVFSQQLTVAKTEQINHDTKRITFALPQSTDASGVPPGRAILTQHTPSGGWTPVFRPYTPVPSEDGSATIQLVVKKYPKGRASGHLHSLQPGQSLTVRGPIPGYAWQPSTKPANLLMVAGGAGITPIYSLIHGVLSDAGDQTKIQLLWGVNGTRDIILKNELEDLEKKFPDRLRVTYMVSGPEARPDAPSLGDAQKYRKGYIDRPALQDAIGSAKQGHWGDAKGTKVFVCGPPAMQETVAGKNGILSELGVEKKAIHFF